MRPLSFWVILFLALTALGVGALLPTQTIARRVVSPSVIAQLTAKGAGERADRYRERVVSSLRWFKLACVVWGCFVMGSVAYRRTHPTTHSTIPSTSYEPATPWRRWEWLLVFLLVSLSFGLGVIALHGAYMVDETANVVLAIRRGLVAIVSNIIFVPSKAHTAYSITQWVTVKIFGETPWGIRLPALLFGCATIAMTYRLTRLVAGVPTAFLGTLILALNTMHLFYCANARGYTLFALAAITATYAAVRVFQSPQRRWWVLLSASIVIGTYAHLYCFAFGIGLVVAQLVSLLRDARVRAAKQEFLRSLFWHAAFASVSLFLLYSMGIPHQLENRSLGNYQEIYPFLHTMGPRFLWILAKEFSLNPQQDFAVGTQLVLAVFGAVSLYRQCPDGGRLLLLPSAVVVGLLGLAQVMVHTRFFFFMLPIYSQLTAFGLVAVGKWLSQILSKVSQAVPRPRSELVGTAIVAAVVLVTGACGLRYFYGTEMHGLRKAVAIMRQQTNTGETVAALTDSAITAQFYWPAISGVEKKAQLEELLRTPPDWIVYAGQEYLQCDAPRVVKLLQEQYENVATVPGWYRIDGTAYVWKKRH